jgi:hypothetical protein
MPALYALTYGSEARHALLPSQIDHILQRSRERNALEGVTGVLLYTNNNFMQYLEGPLPGLERIWAIIEADPLHHRIVKQAMERIWVREFEQWSMAFRTDSGLGMSHPMHLDAMLSGRASAHAGTSSAAVRQLLAFWEQHRGDHTI